MSRSTRSDRKHVSGFATAARLGELLGLQWPDVDLDAGAISIERSLEELRGKHRLKEPKTKKARRRLALSRFAQDALAEHRQAMLAAGNIRGQVFCERKGGFLPGMQEIAATAMQGILCAGPEVKSG